MLWGSFFFLSNEVIEHQYSVKTISSVFSNVGGLLAIVMGLLKMPFNFVNRKFIIAKLIRNLYFKEIPEEQADKRNLKK